MNPTTMRGVVEAAVSIAACDMAQSPEGPMTDSSGVRMRHPRLFFLPPSVKRLSSELACRHF